MYVIECGAVALVTGAGGNCPCEFPKHPAATISAAASKTASALALNAEDRICIDVTSLSPVRLSTRPDCLPYSVLKASTGFTEAAARAGRRVAITAGTSSAAIDTAYTSGSFGLTP